MTIYERAREVILNPRVAWLSIKQETVEPKQLLIDYAAPLALIPPVSSLIGMTLFGVRMTSGSVFRAPFFLTLFALTASYLVQLGLLWLGAFIITKLAKYFNTQADFKAAFKIVVYSMTPVWLAGIFSLIPGLGILSLLGLYGFYVLSIGLQEVLACPQEKTPWFVLALTALSFFISLVVNAVLLSLFFYPLYLRMLTV